MWIYIAHIVKLISSALKRGRKLNFSTDTKNFRQRSLEVLEISILSLNVLKAKIFNFKFCIFRPKKYLTIKRLSDNFSTAQNLVGEEITRSPHRATTALVDGRPLTQSVLSESSWHCELCELASLSQHWRRTWRQDHSAAETNSARRRRY